MIGPQTGQVYRILRPNSTLLNGYVAIPHDAYDIYGTWRMETIWRRRDGQAMAQYPRGFTHSNNNKMLRQIETCPVPSDS